MKNSLIPTLISLALAICPSSMSFAQNLPLSDYSVDYDEYDDYSAVVNVINTLKLWNDALNSQNIQKLKELYDSVVDYYHSNYENDMVMQSKKRLFSKYPDYYQYSTDITLETSNDYTYFISFNNHVKTEANGTFKTYPAYLEITGYDSRIQLECDSVTDANMERKRKNSPPQIFEVTPSTTLSQLFCEANVGKEISTSYWDLAESSTESEIAAAMEELCGEISLRISMYGPIKKNYRGQKGTYYCNGGQGIGVGGGIYLIWVYDSLSGKLTVL